MTVAEEIAKKVGVCRQTVSAVLNGKTYKVSREKCEQIHRLAEDFKYQPNMLARQLAGARSDIIGVVLDSCAPTIWHNRLARMEYYASQHGYRFMIGQAHENYSKIIKFAEDFISYKVAGIICMAHKIPGHEKEIAEAYPLEKTVFLEKPVVSGACYVAIDLKKAFHDVVLYLAGRGRKRIAQIIIGGSLFIVGMDTRVEGFHSGLSECGLKPDRRLHAVIPIGEMANIDSILPVVRELLKHGADAIVCPNDHIAAGVLKACSRLGVRVPEDLAVTGYDDVDFCQFLTPSLTTFYGNNELAARTAVELLLKLMNNPSLPAKERSVILSPVFIEREST